MNKKIIESEKQHSKWIFDNDPHRQWAWDTPAGGLRAKRRGWLIAKGAKLGHGQRVLEIGCGTGYFTEMFLKYGGNILAVDLSPELLKVAVARLRNLPAFEEKMGGGGGIHGGAF
jgi:ubiquinone/menaquinone biosynthesis C-methylase UbiE